MIQYFEIQLIVSKETLTKNSQLSRKHVQDLQSNLSKLLATNDTLNSDLQTASKTIVRMKIERKKNSHFNTYFFYRLNWR